MVFFPLHFTKQEPLQLHQYTSHPVQINSKKIWIIQSHLLRGQTVNGEGPIHKQLWLPLLSLPCRAATLSYICCTSWEGEKAAVRPSFDGQRYCFSLVLPDFIYSRLLSSVACNLLHISSAGGPEPIVQSCLQRNTAGPQATSQLGWVEILTGECLLDPVEHSPAQLFYVLCL